MNDETKNINMVEASATSVDDEASARLELLSLSNSLNKKMDTLMKIMYSYDLNIKLVLDRTNKMYQSIDNINKYIEELKASDAELVQQALKTTNTEVVNNDPIKIEGSAEAKVQLPPHTPQTPASPRRTARPQPAAPERQRPPKSAVTAQPAQQLPTPTAQPVRESASNEVSFKNYDEDASVKKSSSNEKKLPVIQRITDDKGRDLFLARVNILDENKQEVFNTKTNAVGKWQANLAPGRYFVNITKTDTTSNTVIESQQQITIPNSGGSVTLPVAIIKRA